VPSKPRARALLVIAIAAIAACRKVPSPTARASALEVEPSGCAAIAQGRACVVGEDGALRVLVLAPGDATFACDGGAVDAERLAAFEDASLHRVRPAPGARRLVVRVGASEGAVDLRWDRFPPWYAEARALSAKGRLDEALDVVRARFGAPDEGEAALAVGQAARFEILRDHVDESVRLFRDAIPRDRRAGRVSAAVDDAVGLAFALSQRSTRYAEARAALDGVRDLLPSYPDGRVLEAYHRAEIDSEAGDRRDALRGLRDADRLATRLGLARLSRVVRTMIASQLDRFGRLEDALAIRRALDRELEGAPEACDRLALRSGLGFGLLLLSIDAGGDAARVREATAALERARGESACTESYLHAVTLGNLAFARLLAGDADAAAALLAEARARVTQTPLSEGFFWLDLEGRIALARGDAARSFAAYDEMERRASAALLPGYEWAALAGRGAALEALGRAREALEAYGAAEERLDDATLAIPVGEGRARFLVERGRSAARGIALLLAAGRDAEAMRWARRSRRRVVAGLEASRRVARLDAGERTRWEEAVGRYAQERAAIDGEAARDWMLPVNELAVAQARRREREGALRGAVEGLLAVGGGEASSARAEAPPAAGELLLAFHPASAGWTGFAADASGVTAYAVPALAGDAPPERLARAILEPARARLARATHVRVLLPGGLARIDVHALPWDGGPLVARVPVEYGLDLAPSPSAPSEPARALVVGDPRRDLPAARVEARDVARALAAPVTLLEGPEATHAAIVGALGAATLFHYAGHATFEGEDGWDSTLPLAANGKLLVSDVLALGRAPAQVVLSGCSAARTADVSPGDSIGVAQAFLVAGSDVVVAPTRPVSDALSARFARALHDALRADPDVARAARAAALALRADDPASDWASFRVLRR
jgi:tetratricopeptide (TPR) repeat protein